MTEQEANELDLLRRYFSSIQSVVEELQDSPKSFMFRVRETHRSFYEILTEQGISCRRLIEVRKLEDHSCTISGCYRDRAGCTLEQGEKA